MEYDARKREANARIGVAKIWGILVSGDTSSRVLGVKSKNEKIEYEIDSSLALFEDSGTKSFPY